RPGSPPFPYPTLFRSELAAAVGDADDVVGALALDGLAHFDRGDLLLRVVAFDLPLGDDERFGEHLLERIERLDVRIRAESGQPRSAEHTSALQSRVDL